MADSSSNKSLPGLSENWTEEQFKAITCSGADTLVSAAAGSGKTRVLVERVLRKISDPAQDFEIDRLLIVTFTNAAADEMKQRIAAEIKKSINEQPENSYLRKQLLLLNHASICTIHSFCRDVIKNFYYLRGIDPSFRVMEETEAGLLRQEILEEVLEKNYAKNSPESLFYRLVDIYSNEKGDQPLKDLLQKVYDFSRSNLWPQQWLQENISMFDIRSREQLKKTTWMKDLLQHCRTEIEKIVKKLQRGIAIATTAGGPQPYLPNLQQSLRDFTDIYNNIENYSFEELCSSLETITFNRLSPCKGDDYDPVLKDEVSAIYNKCKSDLKGLKQEIFNRSLYEHIEDLSNLKPYMEELVYLVNSFSEKYKKAKAERGVMDFSDLEHNALNILTHVDSIPPQILPSEAARSYNEHFLEVLVDEYQDINQVQEAILNLVAGTPNEGRFFMVGDVKQSIYRFRLAEPRLFLNKYYTYSSAESPAQCVNLSYNFRCTREIVRGVNYLFSRIMDRGIGEVEYDDAAQLMYGETYPQNHIGTSEGSVPTLFIIHRSSPGIGTGAEEDDPDEEEQDFGYLEEWENAELEGKFIAQKIRELLGEDNNSCSFIFDRKENRLRKITYSDIAILLRSAKNWAPSIVEELGKKGIPAFTKIHSGYFDTVEIQVMISLLKIIDNPYQDFPITAVLRSPIVGLNAEQLSLIRLAAPGKSFYEALLEFLRVFDSSTGGAKESQVENNTYLNSKELNQISGKDFAVKLRNFYHYLVKWRQFSRDHSLSELIWKLYLDTGYFEMVGGMPGGEQRQSNLRLFYQKAKQYESTSYRGLFNFLRFVEKLMEHGGEFAASASTGEQEDAVRVLTVHESKGLEFPVVFLAGLNKKFNTSDLKKSFLLHKDKGFGPRYINPELRLSYPTLPWLSIKNSLWQEMLSEEMRILYVAMTRAEQKLYLIGTVKDYNAHLSKKWDEAVKDNDLLLPKYYRSEAKCMLDWIAPVLVRHSRELSGFSLKQENGSEDMFWQLHLLTPQDFMPGEIDPVQTVGENGVDTESDESLKVSLSDAANLQAGPPVMDQVQEREIKDRLSFKYPFNELTRSFAKISVSELKRLQWAGLPGDDSREPPWTGFLPPRLPRFLNKEGLSAAEKGTAFHAVMQYLDLNECLDVGNIARQMEKMEQKEQITSLERKAVDPEIIAKFFNSFLGKRILSSSMVMREVPFTLTVPVSVVNSLDFNKFSPRTELVQKDEDLALVQGVVDCIWREEGGLYLLDFKTDSGAKEQLNSLRENYRFQIEFYAAALEKIWKEKILESYLYFFFLQDHITVQF